MNEGKRRIRFHRRFKAGDLGRLLIMRNDVDQRAIVIGNLVILWDAHKFGGGKP